MPPLILALLLVLQDPISASNAAQLREAATLAGHQGPVFGVALGPDGKLLASAGIDKTVRLWDLASGKQLAQFDGHTKQAVVVGFSADGKTLLSAGYDDAVRLWDVAGKKPIEVQKKNPKDERQIVDLESLCNAFTSDGTLLVMGGRGIPYVWDTRSKTSRSLGAAGTATAGYLGISADGRTLAVAATKGETESEVQIWDLQAGKSLDKIAPPAGAYYGNEAVAVSPDGSLVACADSTTSEIHVMETKSKSLAKRLKGHKHDDSGSLLLLGLAFSPDGKLLASGSYDKTLRLWDVAAGKELASYPARSPAFVVFSKDGTKVAASGVEGVIQVWSTR